MKRCLFSFFWLLCLVTFGENFVVSSGYHAGNRLSTREMAELRVSRRGGAPLVILKFGRRGLELWGYGTGEGNLLTEARGDFVRAGKSEARLWFSGKEILVELGGRIAAKAPGVQITGRPEVSFVPSKGIAQSGRPRLQKLAPIDFSDDFARVEDDADSAQWEVLSGDFEVNMSRNPGSSQGAFQLWSSSPEGRGIALSRASCWFWKDCRQAASFLSTPGGTVGLVFCWLDSRNYHALEVRDTNCTLVRYRDGQRKILAEVPCARPANAWMRLEAVCLQGDIAAFLGGRRILSVHDAQAVAGRFGLLLQDNALSYFDDALVCSATAADLSESQSRPFGPCEQQWSDFSGKNFLTDQFMAQWAHPRASWHSAPDGLHWFRSRFFHDVALAWTQLPRQKVAKPLRIRLFGEEGNADAGYLFTIGTEAILSRQGQEVARAAVPAGTIQSLEASASAGVLSLSVNGNAILTWQDAQPITEGFLGADLGRANAGVGHLHRPDWRDSAIAKSSHRLDYSFEHAPAAWFPQAGTWQGTHRWACVPKWSFFGGRSSLQAPETENANALLWNLRKIQGDFDLEIFAAPREGTPQRVHFSWPVAIGVAFCADGTRLSSGYNFLFGSYDIPSRLFLHDKELAVNDTLVLPDLRNQDTAWYHRLTQTWQHIRIQKRNGRLLVHAATHDDHANYQGLQQIFDQPAEDGPDAGQFALWTWGPNGIAIARATLSFQNSDGAGTLPLKPLSNSACKGAKHEPKQYQHFVNPMDGGPFANDLQMENLETAGNLRMLFRAAPKTSLSLFVQAEDQLSELPLTANTPFHEYASPIRNAKCEASKAYPGWTEFTIPVQAALQTAFPGRGSIKIQNIFIASPYDTVEEIAGLGVNPLGSWYDVASLSVQPASPVSHTAWRPLYLGQAFLDDFEDSFGQWERIGGPDGAALSLDDRNPASGSRSLRLLNQRIAGIAGANARTTSFPLDAFPQLAMKLRFPAGTEINLLAEAEGQRYEINITGKYSTWPILSQLADMKEDGQWHSCSLELAKLIRSQNPKATSVQRLFLGDSERMDTRQRLSYWVDDFQLVPAIPENGLITINATQTVAGFQLLLDQNLATAPDQQSEQPGKEVRLTGIPEGGCFVHLRPHYADGSYGITRHFRILKAPATIALPEQPRPQAAPPLAPYISYIPSDCLCRYDYETIPGLQEGNAVFGDSCIRREAWALQNNSDAATGKACLELVNLSQSGFCSVYLHKGPWNPVRWPMVAFDYRTGQPGFMLNLSMLLNEAMTVVEWTGPNGYGNYFWDSIVGRTSYALQDGHWHSTEFNLLQMLKETRYPKGIPGDLSVAELATWATVHNGGGYSNPEGASLFFDNFTIYSNRGKDPAFQWRLPADQAKAYSFLFDQSPDSIPPEKEMTTETRQQFHDVHPGKWFFHVRACSPDGTWGPASTHQITIEP